MRSCKLPVPTVLLSNVRSLRSKTDELQANVNYMHEYRQACLLAFTETWLDGNVQDSDLFIDEFDTPIRLDRNKRDTWKEQGGGVCFYVNRRWCRTVIVRDTHFARLILSSCPSHFGPSVCQGNSPNYRLHLFTSTHASMPQGLQNLFQTTSTN